MNGNMTDDWKYFEGEEEQDSVYESDEKQCGSCQRWIDRDSLYCVWCGKPGEQE